MARVSRIFVCRLSRLRLVNIYDFVSTFLPSQSNSIWKLSLSRLCSFLTSFVIWSILSGEPQWSISRCSIYSVSLEDGTLHICYCREFLTTKGSSTNPRICWNDWIASQVEQGTDHRGFKSWSFASLSSFGRALSFFYLRSLYNVVEDMWRPSDQREREEKLANISLGPSWLELGLMCRSIRAYCFVRCVRSESSQSRLGWPNREKLSQTVVSWDLGCGTSDCVKFATSSRRLNIDCELL